MIYTNDERTFTEEEVINLIPKHFLKEEKHIERFVKLFNEIDSLFTLQQNLVKVETLDPTISFTGVLCSSVEEDIEDHFQDIRYSPYLELELMDKNAKIDMSKGTDYDKIIRIPIIKIKRILKLKEDVYRMSKEEIAKTLRKAKFPEDRISQEINEWESTGYLFR